MIFQNHIFGSTQGLKNYFPPHLHRDDSASQRRMHVMMFCGLQCQVNRWWYLDMRARSGGFRAKILLDNRWKAVGNLWHATFFHPTQFANHWENLPRLPAQNFSTAFPSAVFGQPQKVSLPKDSAIHSSQEKNGVKTSVSCLKLKDNMLVK